MKLLKFALLSAAFTYTLVPIAQAQNAQAEFANGFPIAPTGLQNLPLGDGPWEYRTGEDMNVHVELVARMQYAMAMAFTPDGALLVAGRAGKLFRIDDDKLSEVSGGPEAVMIGEAGGIGAVHGYMDIKIHPDFKTNQLIYLAYHRKDEALPAGIVSIGRGRLVGSRLEDFQLIYDSVDMNGGMRIVFGPDEKLYASMPDRDSQNLLSRGGKILRLNDDGSIPPDNPFVNRRDALPEIWSYGHRYSLGLTVRPGSEEIWQSENGPNGGDEVNIIRKGQNYGWPEVSFGRTYNGPWHSKQPKHDGYTYPEIVWIPSVATAGMTFYTGDQLDKWQGDLFIGSLRTGEVNGTGHLERVLFNSNMEELRRESLLVDLHKRIRDVVQGPDGYLYVALEDQDGGVLRIKPAK